MDEQTRVLIEIRVDRAREDMETARELVDLGRYRAAVNRAYYAIFGITTALLLTEKIERSKHTGVESALIQHFTEIYHPDNGIFSDTSGALNQIIKHQRPLLIATSTIRIIGSTINRRFDPFFRII